MAPSVFHAGERAVQERLGVRDIEGWARKVVRPFLPDQHRTFYGALPFLVAAARDAEGRPWATLLAAAPGFVTTPDDRTLRIAALPVAGDALDGAFDRSRDLGLLGIDLAARRRNRVNGRVTRDGDTLTLAVGQTFGNCPQYIHERDWQLVDPDPEPPQRSAELGAAQRALIETADTFFIASGIEGDPGDPAVGMDASHRGGDPGFVRVEGPRRLVFPDYAGNNHYNTIGNLTVDERVGLTFIDFAAGTLLQITGRATIDWDSPAIADFPGARRLVAVAIDEVVALTGALPLRWAGDARAIRTLRLVDKRQESADVASFVFEARDGGALPDFEGGQHLPLDLPLGGRRVARTYSLSNGPAEGRYRITVKRHDQGLVSRALHDGLQIGDFVSARPPAGDFVLAPGDHPAVLLSAGVGLTPMVSMLHELADPNRRAPVWFLHGARDGTHHPLRDEVEQLARRRPGITVATAYSQPQPGDRFDHEGRVTGAWVQRLTALPEGAHYYLCGPLAFMANATTALEAAGVPPDRIHSETFGA